MAVTLPFGNIQMLEGDLLVRLDGEGKLDRFRLTTQSLVPNVPFLNDMRILGPFAADIGYEYGAALTDVKAPLKPDQQYILLDLGAGFQIASTVQNADGVTETVALAVPRGQHLKLVLDPEQPLAYVEGVVTMYDLADLSAINGLLAANNIALPLPANLSLPTRTAIGVTGLLSGDMADSYLELTGGMAVDLGILGQLAGVQGTPLAIQGVARIEDEGLTLTGLAEASVLPDMLVDGSGGVQLFLPFKDSAGAPYVRYGGDFNVPLTGFAVAGDTTLGGGTAENAETGAVASADPTVGVAPGAAPEESSWWDRAGAWVGGVTESAVTGAQAGAAAVQGAFAGGGEGVQASAGAVVESAKEGAGGALEATTASAACASAYAEMLWCEATGFCEVKAPSCGEAK